jgi:hypothetical protein
MPEELQAMHKLHLHRFELKMEREIRDALLLLYSPRQTS